MKAQEEKGRTIDYHAVLRPETDMEWFLLGDGEFVDGLSWGIPRYGHPEGKIYLHIGEVLANIDLLGLAQDDRRDLRLIALLHDTFKYRERKGVTKSRNGSHHGYLARVYAEMRFGELGHLLDLIEWHDEAYFAWRKVFLQGETEEGLHRLERLKEMMGERLELYYHFFWCDTRTGDKNPAPLIWFEQKMADIVPPISHPKGTLSFTPSINYKRISG